MVFVFVPTCVGQATSPKMADRLKYKSIEIPISFFSNCLAPSERRIIDVSTFQNPVA